MTNSPTYTPPIWRTAALVVFTATMGLADVWLVAWLLGNMWGIAIAAGMIVGMMISIAWAVRHYRSQASIGLLVVAAALTSVVAVTSPRTAALGVVVALSVFGVWCLALMLVRQHKSA
jgi:hypothetical protein